MDSFITDSGRKIFSSRLYIETTGQPLSSLAKKALDDQEKGVSHIHLEHLRESSVLWSEALTPQKKDQKSSKPHKTLRAHQQQAFDRVTKAFKETDRGTLVMACGTGKTLTALRIAEHMATTQGSVLVLSPSLALVNQMIKNWHEDATVPLRSFAVCSDSSVGKRKSDDVLEITRSDLLIPATTDAKKLAQSFSSEGKKRRKALKVIFSTYHSIDVLCEAQKKHKLPKFDLVIADEAHRTTGVDRGEDSSYFTKMHSNLHLRAKKRLYMTATPRIYTDNAKATAKDKDALLCSMDDTEIYGNLLYDYKFSDAIKDGWLSDYKIIILHLPATEVAHLQESYSQYDQLTLDDTAKAVGCWKAINKIGVEEGKDNKPLKKVLAFTNTIQSSKYITKTFSQVIQEYQNHDKTLHHTPPITFKHVDGAQSSLVRSQTLRWLADNNSEGCRVVSNVRCLSEGVDVPELDGIVFFHPKKSHMEVVQAVGRVMRKAKGKELGYIILPVVTPSKAHAREVLHKTNLMKLLFKL